MSADFWAGYISGAIGIVIGNPLDIVKVRLQAGREPGVHRHLRSHFESTGSLVRGGFGIGLYCENILLSY